MDDDEFDDIVRDFRSMDTDNNGYSTKARGQV